MKIIDTSIEILDAPDYGKMLKKIERIGHITDYLVGTMDRWNSAKTAEERDRVKHGVMKKEGQ